MHPCHPKTLPAEDGGLVRRIGSKGSNWLYSLTYWTGGKLYQTTVWHPDTPSFSAVENYFEMHFDRWTAVPLPTSPSL